MSNFYFVSFQVKTKATADTWDIKEQAATYSFSLGDSLSWLNYKFGLACKSYKNYEGFVSWTIRDETNFYNGLFQLSNENFLEKVLNIDTIKNKLEDFRNESE
jgi:hypothetical protein